MPRLVELFEQLHHVGATPNETTYLHLIRGAVADRCYPYAFRYYRRLTKVRSTHFRRATGHK